MSSKDGEEDDRRGKDAAILQELKEISNRHSSYNKSLGPRVSSSSISSSTNTLSCMGDKENALNNMGDDNEVNDNQDCNDNTFLSKTNENRDLNQYWYSKHTIDTLCNAIREGLSLSSSSSSSSVGSNNARVAFLSTPSLFFSLSSKERKQCTLFDLDETWESCSEYHFYDYNNPTNIKECCHGVFDLIVIDPPFISKSVWEKYAITAKLLMKKGGSRTSGGGVRIIATTVDENTGLMEALFGCKPVVFRPSIPRLVYQYSVFTNFSSSVLDTDNLELV